MAEWLAGGPERASSIGTEDSNLLFGGSGLFLDGGRQIMGRINPLDEKVTFI